MWLNASPPGAAVPPGAVSPKDAARGTASPGTTPVEPVTWMTEAVRGSAGGRGDRPRLSADSARRLARACWSELTNHDPNVFPVQAERRGVRFYLQEERGGQRLSALVWDGFQWRTVGSLRLPASD